MTLPLALWLPTLTAVAMLALCLAPKAWFGSDPTSGYSLAVVALTICGVANAAIALFAPQWWRFVGLAAGAHIVLLAALLVYGVVGPLKDAGPAAMALLLPILFPGMAFAGAALLRGLKSIIFTRGGG